METDDELYLEQKLQWVKYRLEMLDEIEARLTEMRSIAVLAENSDMAQSTRQRLNERFHLLEREVHQLDEKSRIFRMDCR